MNRSSLYIYKAASPGRSWQPIGLAAITLVVGLLLASLPPTTGGLIAVSLGALILIIIQPLFGLGLSLLAGPFGAFEDIILPGSLPTIGQIIFLITVAAWLGQGVVRKRIVIADTELNRPLILFIILALLSLLDAYSLDQGLKEAAKWVGLSLAMAMTITLSGPSRLSERKDSNRRDPFVRRIRWVLVMLFLAAMIQAVIGIWQFGLWQNGPDHFLILGRFYRAFGTFMQPNPFGGYMAITAALAIGVLSGLVIQQFRQDSRDGNRRLIEIGWFLFVLFTAILTLTALIMSWSRGAWLGFAAGMGIFAMFFPRKQWQGVVLILAGALILVVAYRANLLPLTITQRLGNVSQDSFVGDVRGVKVTTENYADIERLAHWQAGIGMARDNLLSGVGFGNYEPAYVDYGLLNWPIPLGHAHNYYINVLAETGVFGALAYLLLWIFVFFQLLGLLRKIEWPQRGITLGLLAAWTALSVHLLVDNLYVNSVYLSFGVMLGLQQIIAHHYD